MIEYASIAIITVLVIGFKLGQKWERQKKQCTASKTDYSLIFDKGRCTGISSVGCVDSLCAEHCKEIHGMKCYKRAWGED
jgi:hypothetical protein